MLQVQYKAHSRTLDLNCSNKFVYRHPFVYSETGLSGHLNKAVTFLLQPKSGGPKLSQ